jgi:hypothetical protein
MYLERNSKFYRTLELYWHTKTMVAIGMLPKEQDFCQLKSRQEALEIQNAYLTEVVTWLARHQGGNFVPPARNYAGMRPQLLLLNERLWTLPALRFSMESDILLSVFLSVIMLSRLLDMALSIVKLELDRHYNFRLVKTWFPLRGSNIFCFL